MCFQYVQQSVWKLDIIGEISENQSFRSSVAELKPNPK